ncbi:MAG: hypothetical protein ACLGXA_05575 [Acidobacteriota bacterium]
MPGRVFGVLGRMNVVSMGQVSVVSGLLMVARIVMLRRFSMVVGGHPVMMSRRTMLVRCLL